MKQSFYGLVAAILLATGSLYAKHKEDLSKIIDEIVAQTAMGNLTSVNASARPEVEGDHFFLFFDVLYWHSRVGGTSFALTNNNLANTLPIHGNVHDVRFNWDWGFRVGAGINLPHDFWDIEVAYTHLRVDKKGSANGTPINSVTPLKGSQLINQTVLEARSFGRINLDTIDALLGRETFLSPYLALRPAFGLKTSWLRFKQRTSYAGGFFLNVNTLSVLDKSDYWGIGPKIGAASQWFLGNGFSVYASLFAAFQYGVFDVIYDEQMSHVPTNRIKIRQKFHQFAPEIEYGVGLGWGQYVNKLKQFVELGIWYEGEYWFNQNQSLEIVQPNAFRIENIDENISFHGVTLKARVYF